MLYCASAWHLRLRGDHYFELDNQAGLKIFNAKNQLRLAALCMIVHVPSILVRGCRSYAGHCACDAGPAKLWCHTRCDEDRAALHQVPVHASWIFYAGMVCCCAQVSHASLLWLNGSSCGGLYDFGCDV